MINMYKMKKTRYDPDIECEALVRRMNAICEFRKLSYNSIAQKAEMSSSSVYSILKGRTRPSVHTLFKLCNAMEITIDQLFPTEENVLGMEEKELIRCYREASEDGRTMLRLCMEMVDKGKRV